MKYKSVSKISVKVIEKAGPDDCAEFDSGLQKFAFLAMQEPASYLYAETIPCKIALGYAKQIPGGFQFLIDNSFIAKDVPEITFAPKTLFQSGEGTIYMLTIVAQGMVALINTEKGTRWSDMINAKNAYHVTQTEFISLAGSGSFKKLDGYLKYTEEVYVS